MLQFLVFVLPALATITSGKRSINVIIYMQVSEKPLLVIRAWPVFLSTQLPWGVGLNCILVSVWVTNFGRRLVGPGSLAWHAPTDNEEYHTVNVISEYFRFFFLKKGNKQMKWSQDNHKEICWDSFTPKIVRITRP